MTDHDSPPTLNSPDSTVEGFSSAARPMTFDGTCRFCSERFEYQAPAVVMRGRTMRITGPRRVCYLEACLQKAEEELAAVIVEERYDDLAERRRAYMEQVPAIYHRAARIAPASQSHLVNELQEWKPTQSLYLHGPSSSGKSHQVAALMHRVAGRMPYRWYSTRRLLADAQAAFGRNSIEPPSIIADPLRPRVLVLNDIFAERATEWAATTIGNLVDARYEAGLPIVFTSNVAPSEIPGTVEVGRRDAAAVTLELERIRDRIIEMTTPPWGIRLHLSGTNWRHTMGDGATDA